MGFFSDLGKVATGGLTGMMGLGTGLAAGASGGAGVHAANKAGSEASKGFIAAQNMTREAAEQARKDINELFPEAIERGQIGFQDALNVFGQTIPAQADIFQQGNVGAQQQILSGLPQIQAALLGQPLDFSGLQPTQLNMPDMSFAQQLTPMQRHKDRVATIQEALQAGRARDKREGDQVRQEHHQNMLNQANLFAGLAGGGPRSILEGAINSGWGVPGNLSSLLTGRF